MKKIILFFSILSLSLFLFSSRVYAEDTGCVAIYGGGEVCPQKGNIVVNKKVLNPQTGALVDTLGINDFKFSSDQTVNFKITVTNTGQAMLSKVTVKDILPQFLTFVSGPGSFDANTKTLTFDVTNLNAGESRTFDVTAKVVTSDQMPSDKTITCVFNQAIGTSDSQISQDNVQLCIQKVVPTQTPTTKGGLKVFPPQPVVTTPSTGPEMIPLMGLIPAGIGGFFLKKFSIRKKK